MLLCETDDAAAAAGTAASFVIILCELKLTISFVSAVHLNILNVLNVNHGRGLTFRKQEHGQLKSKAATASKNLKRNSNAEKNLGNTFPEKSRKKPHRHSENEKRFQ